ncbi:MAG: autotransporter-associated beta strand repeat-containing protein [Akkermansia sp.]|nr:autotransporter-associated beta strand repeat-containing protein [Akkermansia sp.]
MNVTETQNLKALRFDSKDDYAFSVASEKSVTATNLYQLGSGTTTLSGTVNVTSTMIEAGSLVVTGTAQSLGSVSGEGELVIDWGANTSGTVNISDLGTLHIKTGSYGSESAAAINVDTIIVDAGATYVQGANIAQTVNLQTAGTVSLSGGSNWNSLIGTVALTGDATFMNRSGFSFIAGGIQGNNHKLIVQGVFSTAAESTGLVLKAQASNISATEVQSGVLMLGGELYHDGTQMGTISVANGAALRMAYGTGLGNATIHLQSGAELQLYNGSGGSVELNGNLTVADGAKIRGAYYGGNARMTGTISGSGTLTLTNEQSHRYYINSSVKDAADAALALKIADGSNAANVQIGGSNTYSGGTTLESGSLTTANSSALGTGNVLINGGTLTLAENLSISTLNGSAGTLDFAGNTLTVGAHGASADASYSGALTSSVSTAGSITKQGSNTQSFTAANLELQDITVEAGTLSLSDVATVAGNITVQDGASLSVADGSITLGEGQTLAVLSGSSGAVTLNALVLDGGNIVLSASGLSADSAALSIASVTGDVATSITLAGMVDLADGKYLLAAGDWSAVEASLFSLGFMAKSAELNPSLSTDSQGLWLTLAAASDDSSNVWAGTDSAYEWNSTTFSQYSTSDALAAEAIFDATAANKSVNVTSAVSTGTVTISSGGYSFSGEGSISTGTLSVSGGGSASSIANIEVSDAIMVDGSELTIVELSPTNPSAPIALSNAAKLTIGDASHRYGAFSGKVTGDAGSQLHLYTRLSTETDYWKGNDTIQLLADSTVQDVYIHGDLALNQASGYGDAVTQLQNANVHFDDNAFISIRQNTGEYAPSGGDIVLHGILNLIVYQPLTETGTIIAGDFVEAEGSTSKLVKYANQDPGNLTLSGNIAVDAIEVQAGTLQLTGSCTSTTVYTVNSGATLALSGSSVYSFDASSVRTINGTLKIDSDVNVSGTGRITIAGGGSIALADGASFNRTSGNGGAYWVQGALVALQDATADFTSVDDVHFHNADNGKIELKSGSTLNMQVKSLQYWRPADISLGANSTLNLTTTNGFDDSDGNGTPKIAISLAEGAAFNVLGGVVNINGSSSLSLGSNAKVNFNGGDVTFASGATLTMGTGSDLKVSSGTMKIQSDIGSADTSSTVTLAGGHLQLNYNGEQSVHSKLSVNNSAATADAPSTSIIRNDAKVDNMTRILRNVSIAKHNVLELQQFGWNTIWNINELTGEGTLRWAASTNHSISSRLILSGDNSFSGLIEFNRSQVDYTWVDNGAYQAYLVLANDGAAKNATISLQGEVSGSNKNNIASMVINTNNAAVQGIIGNELSLIYAGDARESVARNDAAPGTTAANTLTIAGAGDYTFAGTVGTSADAARLSLAMTGEGKQTFSGQAYVGNVSVSKGELVLSQADVDGSVTVSGGALNMTGSAYTLGSGDVLSVLTGTEHAVQLGNLTLSGGEMVFDASLLNADTSALSVGTVSLAEGTSSQLITFNNIDNLESGRYLLSDGWTAVDGLSFTTNTLSQGVASVVMQEGALYLVYNNDGVYTWVGGAEVDGAADTNWSSANWDIVPDTDAGNNLSFAAGKDAIFNSDATAVVSDAVTAGTVYIMNGAKVTWKMEGEGASLSFAHVDVVNGELSLGQQTNWTGMAEISVRKDGALVLSWGTGLAADKLLLQGGTIELYNGSGTYHELNTAITVDGSGRIKGSSNGNSTVLKGSITGTGTLYFEKIHDNPIEIESAMTDGAEGALSVNIGNANIVYDGAKRYTGGTTIGDGGMLTVNSGGQEGGMVGSVDVYGTLKLNAGDATGWGRSANTISAINLYEGGVLNVTVTDNQTGSGIAINLQGGTMTGVANSNFDLAYGGSSRGHSTITALAATGATADNPTVSSIDTVSISLRQNTTVIEVQENAQLNISSSIKQKDNDSINGETAGDYTFTKTGLGELVLSGQNTYTGTTSITGGTLELAGAVSMAADGGAIDVASGATLLLNTTQTLSLNNDITSQGIIHKKSGEEVVLNGDVTASLVNVADGNHQTVHAGTLTFAGDTVKVGKLYLAYGSVNVGSTDGSATFMSLTQLEAGDSEEGNSTVSLTIRDGSTLSVTGNNSTGGASYKSASFLLAEWNASATLNVEGTLLVQNAKVLVGDDATVINISGGTMAVQGITHARGGYNTGLELNLTEGGKLILGASGINTDKPVTATFGEGTVGMSAASTTIAENVTLNSAEGTTFYTTQYAYETNAEGVATNIVRGDEGGDMVVSGDITSAEGVAASMKVAGAGTLHVAGSADVRGNVTVEQGGGMAVSAATDGTATSMATISSADGSNAASISGGVRLSHADAAVSIVGSGMDITEISNSLIALQQGVSLNMNNLHIAAGTQVQGYHAATAASSVMLLDGEVTRNDVALADVSLEISKANAVRGADGANTQAAKVMMLSSSAFSYSSLTGTLTVEFSGEFAHELLAGGYDAVGLSFTETEFDTTAITIVGMYEGISGSVEGYFDTSAGGNAVVYFSTDIIPEPATSTLGLLALAALAYRRRRK